MAKARFFRTADDLRSWLATHHASETELLVGFYKKETRRASVTYSEALDEALAIGWIDGVRRRLDDESYSIRFTPRTPKSIWSKVNIKRAGELIALGRMQAAGLAAFEKRDEKRANSYSYEREMAAFGPAEAKALAADKKASAFFEAQPPGYRRVATHWVVSAKKA
ncbi:MAG TPA: YdeI/OmpD-associated family protein, partial [Gemmatimonadaceae bacterium]